MNQSALEEINEVPEDAQQWITFRLGEGAYGVNVLKVQEVLKYTEITPVPGSQDYVLGIINLRGYVVTVINTRTRLAMPSKDIDEETRIIFVEVRGHIIGMLVDCVTEVVSLNTSDIDRSPGTSGDDQGKGGYIEGVFSNDEEILILMDVESLFEDDELSEVAAY